MPAENANASVTDAGRFAIEWDGGVLDDVRRLAWEGFCAFGHGGLEIGGLLYGRRSDAGLQVCAAVPFESDHALGPGFALSPADQAKLALILESPPEAAAGLELAGWYRSFTRTAVRLSGRDGAMQRLFEHDWQIVLGLKPSRLGPASATVFSRDGDRLLAFDIATGGAVSEAAPPEPKAAPPPVVGPAAVADPPPPEPVRSGRRLAWRPVAVAAAALLLGAGAWRVGRTIALERAASSTPKSIQLRAVKQQDEIRIEWDHAAPAVARAAGAFLELDDGQYRKRLELDALLLRTGSVVYHPQSGDVVIRMQLRGPKGETLAEETTRHLRPPEPVQTAPAPPAVVEAPLRVERADRSEPAAPQPAAPAPRPFVQQALAPAPRPAVEQLPPPPGVPGATSIAPPPQAPVRLPAAPAPAATQAPAPAYRGPRSGRLIWTGYLDRRGVVEVDHGKASLGAVTGSLPGVPVEIRAYPAELGEKGLVVYSGDSALSRARRVEAPGAANGWNRTEFDFDPVRARQIAVLEEPNPTNSFQRLVLRNDARKCAVVLVEWKVK